MTRNWPIHPIADLFPPMAADDYVALREDVREQGVLLPVILWNGQVVDGRHRLRAAQETGRDFDTETLACAESDLPRKVVAYNLHRRHLNESQLGIIAAKMASMKHGGDRKSDQIKRSRDGLISQREAAETMGVSIPTVGRAARVLHQAPERVKDIEAGEATLGGVVKQLRSRNHGAPTHPQLRHVPRKPCAEQFERTLAAVEAHLGTLLEIYVELRADRNVARWVGRLQAVRRGLAKVTHSLERPKVTA